MNRSRKAKQYDQRDQDWQAAIMADIYDSNDILPEALKGDPLYDPEARSESNSIKSPISGNGEPVAISIPEMQNLLECPNQSYVPDPNHCPYAEAAERLNEQCERGINQTTFGKPIFP